MSSDAKSLYLVDAHSLIFQVFHALPEMSSPTGQAVNAIFGFARDILHLRNDRKPTYLVVAFDVEGKLHRETLYPQYKANRAPMPEDLVPQIPMIRDMLGAMNVPVLGMPGFEADDVIATLAHAAAKEGIDVFICSSDKDCRQLLGDRVKIYNLRKRELFDRASLQADWGIAPEQVIDFQTLVGDSVDNVPGVPGIGPKTAATLLQQYQTLDNLIAHIAEVPGKKQENLRASLDKIPVSKNLVTLDVNMPISLEWDRWQVQPMDNAKLFDLFRSFGFRGLADQVRPTGANGTKKKIDTRPVQGTLFGDDDEPVRPANDNWPHEYHLVNTPEKFDRFLADLEKQPRIAVDLETTSLEPRKAAIVGLAFCWKAGEAYYLALRGPEGEETLDPDLTLARLKHILENPAIAKINQNIKYDWEVFRQNGIHLAGVAGDPMIADYLLNAGERGHSMDVLADKHLQHQVIPITDLIGKGKKQKQMDQVPLEKIKEYSAEDADVAWRLCELLEKQLLDQGLHRSTTGPLSLYDDLEIPLIEVLADMEFTGIRLDIPLLQRMGADMDVLLKSLEEEIHQLAGRTFNIASVKQLREVLYKEQGYESQRRTMITGEASTDQETLVRLARQGHALPQRLLEHRQIAKLKGTYIDALPAIVNPETGRVHASFNQTVASTGRLSSSDPNLQNIPIRTEEGGNIRKAFLPAAGWKLFTADYSQIELRLLAHFTDDQALKDAFAQNRDIHASVASQVFGVPENEVTSAQRRMAKTINFGIVYGISAMGLAFRLEVPRDEASRFIDAYFAKYPKILAYQEKLLADCRQKGYVSTILGRRRAIAINRSRSTYKNRNQPEREAINMQIQGSAADLIKVAMVNLHRRLKKERLRTQLLLQIHDELVFEIPPEELSVAIPLIRQEMTGALASQLQVPLGVDMGVGENWLDTEELK